MKTVSAYINSLTSIDVRSNINLEVLICDNNQLTDLDVANNINLVRLGTSNNLLTSIDVTNSANLYWFKVAHNQLTELDLSQNSLLEDLDVSNNQLTNLSVKNGNNGSLTDFEARSNSNLYCIEVDDAIYSNANWSSGIDGFSAFGENCN